VDVEGDCVEEEADCVLVLDELALVLWEEGVWTGGLIGGNVWNEGVCGGEFDKITLVDVCDLDFLVFFRKEGRGNLNGVTPSFSVWEQVKIRVGWKDEETLPSNISDHWGFPSEIEIPPNFSIKFSTSSTWWEEGGSKDWGSDLGYFVDVCSTFDLEVGVLDEDLEVGGDLEGE